MNFFLFKKKIIESKKFIFTIQTLQAYLINFLLLSKNINIKFFTFQHQKTKKLFANKYLSTQIQRKKKTR